MASNASMPAIARLPVGIDAPLTPAYIKTIKEKKCPLY